MEQSRGGLTMFFSGRTKPGELSGRSAGAECESTHEQTYRQTDRQTDGRICSPTGTDDHHVMLLRQSVVNKLVDRSPVEVNFSSWDHMYLISVRLHTSSEENFQVIMINQINCSSSHSTWCLVNLSSGITFCLYLFYYC